MVLDMVVVHPRYWRRGHGTALVKWMNDLADIDQEGLAVAAAKMGVELFQHVGYRLKEVVEISGYDRHPESIFSWLGYRDPVS
jgi:GNAT superfamily N-acetyltransferase